MFNKLFINTTKEVSIVLLFLVCSLAVFGLSPEKVQLTGFVNDYVGLLTPEEVSQLNAIGQSMYATKAAQYAIVVVDSLEGLSREDYALRISQNNLGDSTNNGLLLLVAITDHEYRFEVGRGLEGTLNDARIGRIGRNYLVPAFQQEQYGAGLIAASTAIQELLLNGTEIPEAQSQNVSVPIDIWIYVGFFIIFFGLSSWSAYYRKKHGKESPDDNKYLAAAIIASSLLGRRGGGSGGFGGFGGGGFGGGGAGGRW